MIANINSTGSLLGLNRQFLIQIKYIPLIFQNLPTNDVGRFKRQHFGVRKIATFLQPLYTVLLRVSYSAILLTNQHMLCFVTSLLWKLIRADNRHIELYQLERNGWWQVILQESPTIPNKNVEPVVKGEKWYFRSSQ